MCSSLALLVGCATASSTEDGTTTDAGQTRDTGTPSVDAGGTPDDAGGNDDTDAAPEADAPPQLWAVGGTISGLAGKGLVLSNGAEVLDAPENGGFVFGAKRPDGTAYDVKVEAQPTAPSQVCTVTNGAGTLAGHDVTDVAVTCTTSTFTIGGTVAGLNGTGLVLTDNGGDDLAVAANGAFTFATAIASGQPYAVAVKTPPGAPAQSCVVDKAGGTVSDANVTDVTVTCANLCGNGVLDPGEACDDKNTIDTDACTNACALGPIRIGGTAATYSKAALTALGETFTDLGGTYPPSGPGVVVFSMDGGSASYPDYSAQLAAGGHVLVIGGSATSAFPTWADAYVATDDTALWHQSSDCTNDWSSVGTHPLTALLPATYEFTNQQISYHMLHFKAAQPAGTVVLGKTCHGTEPGVLVTRTYPSGGTFTFMALDLGAYTDANAPTQFVQPFLKGYLAYVRAPHAAP